MRILEVRDGFVKIETEKKLAIASFLLIDDSLKSYIAQVLQIKSAGENSIAYAKVLFLYNGKLVDYDKTLPAAESIVSEFSYDSLKQLFEIQNPIITGKFLDSEQYFSIPKSAFNKKTLISLDNFNNNKTLISNLAKQFQKPLIIDTLGIFDTPKFVAGVDFKLPLNTDALQFLYEDCLNDATSDSKSLIKEIFQDLAEYSKTVPFVPFAALKTIVDDMVTKSHVFKLLVLKNKLAKFDSLGYFAANITESQNLDKILQSDNAIIDLSKLDTAFQNRYLSIILSRIEKLNIDSQIFIETSNAIDKKTLKKVVLGNPSTTIVAHPRFKYINEIKTMFENFIIEPSFANNEIFKKFATLLTTLPKNSYIVVSKDTSYTPFASNFGEKLLPETFKEENVISEVSSIETDPETEIEEICVESAEKELTEELLKDLESALEEDVENINPSVAAIDKKSEDLIDKVSEEIHTESIPSGLMLFNDESDTIEENEEVSDDISDQETTIEEISDIEESEKVETQNISKNIESNDDHLIDTIEDNEQVIKNELEEEVLAQIDNEEESDINEKEEFHTQIDEIQTIEIPGDISDLAEEAEALNLEEEIVDEPISEIAESDEIVIEQASSDLEEAQEINDYSADEFFTEENSTQEDLDVVQFAEAQDIDDEIEEFVELDESEISDTDIIVDFEDEPIEELDEEALDKAIVEDVDKVFTTMKEDSISDSDLDFIDELNGSIDNEYEDLTIEEVSLSEGMEELTEISEFESEENDDADFLEPLEEINDQDKNQEPIEKEILEKRNTTTPIVPVYGAEIPAEDMVVSDNIEQGDTVVHAKYGNGIVEKMIKYGTKTLFSINFDNVGRRLLDPTLTEIKKA